MLNKIVTLEDDKEYCIISSTIYEGNKYYCGVEYFENTQEVSKKYYVFKELIEDDGVSLELITDDELFEYIVLKISSENDEKGLNSQK